MRSLLLTYLIALFLVVTIASPVPDAESGVEFPIPLNDGITTDFISFGGYSPPPPPPHPQILGGNNDNIASQAAESVLGDDSQDLSTAWGEDLAPTPQSDTFSQLMFEPNRSKLLAQAHFEDQIYSSQKSDTTQTPFQRYKDAECGGTKSVCCSGIRIDNSYDEPPGVPLPCSDSMQFSFISPPPPSFYKQQKGLFFTKENTKMIDAGYERYLWPGDNRAERYCLEPVYLTDCNTVYVSFFFFFFFFLSSPFSFRESFIIIHYQYLHLHHLPPPLVLTSITILHLFRPSIHPVAVSPIAKSPHNK